MSKWSGGETERVFRALIVQAFGPEDMDACGYIRRSKRADDGRDPTANGGKIQHD